MFTTAIIYGDLVPAPQIGVAVLTLNAEKDLKNCLTPLLSSALKPRILVVDSSSRDRTVEIAQELGAETLVIPQSQFNHGLTRELARKHLKTDIVVMITPDAYAVDNQALEKLIWPIQEGKAAAAYGRQLPHDGADFFEAFPRYFNYPSESQLRSIEDLPKLGSHTFFCSDSFAAYSNALLDEIGGFRHVLLGEDTVAVAMLLRKGYKVAYCADACVKHSHSYSLWQEFQRYFDTGIARSHYGHLLAGGKADQKRGRHFLHLITKELWQKDPLKLPYAWVHTAVKWLGYQLGKYLHPAPNKLKKQLSSQPYFWQNHTTLKPVE